LTMNHPTTTKTRLIVSKLDRTLQDDLLHNCTKRNLTGESQSVESLEERQWYDKDHDDNQPKVLG
jgi:hypothetical protein